MSDDTPTDDEALEPPDHSGDPDADPAAVDPDHTPDPDYREEAGEVTEGDGSPDVDR